jgi:MFS family permease
MTLNSPATPDAPVPEEKSSGFNIQRAAIIGVGALIGLILLVFLVAVLLATAGNEWAVAVQVVRDMVFTLLALVGILVIVAFAILEVKPVLENAQDTMRTAQVTIQFVSDNVAEPIIKASGFVAGISLIIREIFGIRRALQPREESEELDIPEPSTD